MVQLAGCLQETTAVRRKGLARRSSAPTARVAAAVASGRTRRRCKPPTLLPTPRRKQPRPRPRTGAPGPACDGPACALAQLRTQSASQHVQTGRGRGVRLWGRGPLPRCDALGRLWWLADTNAAVARPDSFALIGPTPLLLLARLLCSYWPDSFAHIGPTPLLLLARLLCSYWPDSFALIGVPVPLRAATWLSAPSSGSSG
jgi:hypothetical protein